MKKNGAYSKTTKKAFAQGDHAMLAAKAAIAGNMDKVSDLFPKGSVSKKSRPKPEIWERWTTFKKEMAVVKSAAKELPATATTDEINVGEKFVKFELACDNCHKTFRGRRK